MNNTNFFFWKFISNEFVHNTIAISLQYLLQCESLRNVHVCPSYSYPKVRVYVPMCLCAYVPMCLCANVPMYCSVNILPTVCKQPSPYVTSLTTVWYFLRHLQQYGTSYVTYNSMVLLTSLTTVWYFIRNFLHTVCKQLSPYVTSLTTVWYFIRNFLHTVCKQLSPYVTSLTTVWYFLRNFLHTVCKQLSPYVTSLTTVWYFFYHYIYRPIKTQDTL